LHTHKNIHEYEKKIIYTLVIGTMALIACQDEPSYTIHRTIVFDQEVTYEDILENYTQTAVGIEFFSRISQNDKLALKIIPKLPESCLGNPKVQQVIEKFR
jgi:hypothetical protein